jgi:uncharacterized protein with von Willebrand factor type A (vWA) domain
MTDYHKDIYEQFIESGKIASRKECMEISEIVRKWEPNNPVSTNIDKIYSDLLNEYISDNKINNLLEKYPGVKDDIAKKLFELLENIEPIKNGQDYHTEETIRLNNFSSLPVDEFRQKWSKEKEYLKRTYTKGEIPFDFFQNKIDNSFQKRDTGLKLLNSRKKEIETTKSADKSDALKKEINQLDKDSKNVSFEIKAIHNNLKAHWQRQLELKIFQEKIKEIDGLRKNYLNELYKDIEKLKEILKSLNPFITDFPIPGRLWDLSKGNWHKVEFELLNRYSDIIKQQKELQELADLLGKYRHTETELENEEIEKTEIINKFVINHSGKSELIGITESNDLNNLLPTELALFSYPATENIFYKRYAEKKLQSYEFISKQKYFETIKTTAIRQKERESDKGPFILAIDTSGSMHGKPEQFAKVLAFAITKIAYKEKRKAFIISFSNDINMFELTHIKNSLTKLIDFLQMSFYGGTDVTEAVNEAIRLMLTENYKKADLLIITDGIFGKPDDKTLQAITLLKNQGNKFNSLIIGESQNNSALDFCDNNWTYDFSLESLKRIINDIKNDL